MLRAIGAFLIPAAAGARLDHDVGLGRALGDAMLLVPPLAHPGGKDRKGAVDRRLDRDCLADGGGHDSLSSVIHWSFSRSASYLKLSWLRSHCASLQQLLAPSPYAST